jgi:hypothetical protein
MKPPPPIPVSALIFQFAIVCDRLYIQHATRTLGKEVAARRRDEEREELDTLDSLDDLTPSHPIDRRATA